MKRRTRRGDSVDNVVGARLREERVRAGWSQQQLAEVAQVSFQQVQKYENGANRVSAGRLAQFARALDVPVESFFLYDPETGSPPPSPKSRTRLVLELVRAFNDIDNDGQRRAIVDLVRTVARYPHH
jgi:transcriptional regulator with XRE-family HTH domain